MTVLAALEHIPNPNTVLREIRRILRPNGLLVIEVPTIPTYLPLIRSRWRMFIGDHYWFFTDASMNRLLRKMGFTTISRSYITKTVDLETVSARLADQWQPNNLGRVGRLISAGVRKFGLGGITFPVILFDGKLYAARATD